MEHPFADLRGKYVRVRLLYGSKIRHGVTARAVRSFIGILESTGETSVGVMVGHYTTPGDRVTTEVVHVIPLDMIDRIEEVRGDTHFGLARREWFVEASV